MSENYPLEPVEIGPNRAPGRIWLRLSTDNELLREQAFEKTSDSHDMISGWVKAELIKRSLPDDEALWVHFYGGDSGRCYATIFTTVGEQLHP